MLSVSANQGAPNMTGKRSVSASGNGKARRRRFKPAEPQTHRLPPLVMWKITILTALGMALANFCSIWIIAAVVKLKFTAMQMAIDSGGVVCGVAVLLLICMSLATCCSLLVTYIAPGAGGSGAPENKGWLNGNNIPGLFTLQNLFGRALATILANTSGYPVGREGPTVTMGSNMAFLLTHWLALPYVTQWIEVDRNRPASLSSALIVDEERFSHAKRIVCVVGGACGMAMLFDSPIGGIVYMFEEITSASWPLELTFRAFTGTIICALASRALLEFCGTSVKAFVVYEWNPIPQPWTWWDMPFFALVACFLGPFSAFHTRACLGVAAIRQKVMGTIPQYQPYAKMFDAIFYAGICASTYAGVAHSGKCFPHPGRGQVPDSFVRFNCDEGEYNPVASLLLTTTDAAVKRLFSTRDTGEFHWQNELLAFLAYTTLNIFLTGIPVPSGNFTGSMLIGGLAGRVVGALVRTSGFGGAAVPGVYAMIGSAAMLCGFKQMSVAVVIFITGCANDLNLIPPMMLSVSISLFLNQLFNERGFDEEQIMRKKIPFLPGEPPLAMDRLNAIDLCDKLPAEAVLSPKATITVVRLALKAADVNDFPVVRAEDGICIGFTTRERLVSAVDSWDEGAYSTTLLGGGATSSEARRYRRQASLGSRNGNTDGEDEVGQYISEIVGEASGSGDCGKLLQVERIADQIPHQILEDMPVPRFYALFAKAGVRTAVVVSQVGQFVGMISRTGLITHTRLIEEKGDAAYRKRTEDNSGSEEDDYDDDENGDNTDKECSRTFGLLDCESSKSFGPL